MSDLPSLVEKHFRLRHSVRVNLRNFVIQIAVVPLLAGCNQPAAPASENQMPTHAQPTLPKMKIYLGSTGVLDTELALTPEEEETGMMFRTNIPESDSMLFVLPYPMAASFWMTNCPVSLSAAYISPDGVIEEIHHLEKNDAIPVTATNDNIQFVLETTDGWFARHNIGVGTVIRTEKGALSDTFLRKSFPVPTHGQPTLPEMKIYLGAEVLDAELATTADEVATGLMYRTNITDETAMLFVLPQPILPPDGFYMTNCPISLSAAYIGPDGVIEEIHHLEKNDPTPVVAANKNIVYVLEVNDGWFARHNIGLGTLVRSETGSLNDTFRRR